VPDIVRKRLRRVLNSAPWKATSRWLRGQSDWPALEEAHSGLYTRAQVMVYFGDGPAKVYQLAQWLPVFEELNKHHPVEIVLRRPSAVAAVEHLTNLPIVLKRRFGDLMNFVYASNYVLAIYVNNAVSNFQPLGYAPMVHVHVNHGESDKVSMVSNQAKGYDRIFVAGQAAIERHRRALLDFDESKLVRVGRPQLDIPHETTLPPSDKRTIMYAPTWEGENEANNYTSVDLYGPQIVQAVLAQPDVRLVYKPHPRVEASHDPDVARGNQQILQLIEHDNTQGGENIVLMQGDILDAFGDVDALITDISSVGLDFLYLFPDRPLLITDRRTDPQRARIDSPITAAVPHIDAQSISGLIDLLSDTLAVDGHESARRDMRSHYFGDGRVGDSSRAFLNAIDELIADRLGALAGYEERLAGGGVEAG